jgi:uncharacterized membrane protein
VVEFLRLFADRIAIFVEASGAVLVAFGASEALIRTFRDPLIELSIKMRIWRRFAIWLMLALEFELAADIIRSAISPSWSAIGQLAAIAVIRTFLNYFLEKDMQRVGEELKGSAPARS